MGGVLSKQVIFKKRKYKHYDSHCTQRLMKLPIPHRNLSKVESKSSLKKRTKVINVFKGLHSLFYGFINIP